MNRHHARAIYALLFAMLVLQASGILGATGVDTFLKGTCYVVSFVFVLFSLGDMDKAEGGKQ